jgi:ribosomal protein S12 methylthiotransferase accessory factor
MATAALKRDGCLRSSFQRWNSNEQIVDPDYWVLFHPKQYHESAFEPLKRETDCDWVRCRTVRTGEPYWVPKELVFMDLDPTATARFSPGISTGWAAHRTLQEAVARGVRELLERDATTNAWWGHYPVHESDENSVTELLTIPPKRYQRANLHYRFYRIDSPYTSTATMVTVEGEDESGWLFAIGSACGPTLAQSWEKSLCEAIQDRLYVRYLVTRPSFPDLPTSFAEHALYYTLNPEQLRRTVLDSPPTESPPNAEIKEGLTELLDRAPHPPLFRLVTPPQLAQLGLGWVVVRVVIPGLQPLHGNHYFPFLGGPAWKTRNLEEYGTTPPHPFA